MLLSALLALPALAATPALEGPADSVLNAGERPYEVALHAELGFVAALSHTIQFASDTTEIDYVRDAGQDVLFSFARASGDLRIGRHTITLLYQPLDLRTEDIVTADTTINDVTFLAGTPVDFRYSFPFYRGSYTWDVLPATDRELSLGGSLQIRDATISFTSADGTLRSVNRDVGPVPVLKLRARRDLPSGYWYGGEVDGFWAPIRYINGADTDVEGAIADASVRGGLKLGGGTEAFLNLRYLGGGAVGTSDPYRGGDGFTRNWLHFTSVSLGLSLR